MAEKVLMLALSPTMETGTIVKWRLKEGESVANGQILCEVETDKATMEYESINEGTLLKIIVPAGREARVGEAIAVIGEKDEDIKSILEEVSTSPSVRAVEEQEVKEEFLEKKDLTQVEAGLITESLKEQKLPQGVKASPLARKLAERYNIDLKGVRGSGPEARIVKRDIEAAVKQTDAKVRQEISTPSEMEVDKIPVSGKRSIIARRLSESKFSAPHYYLKVIVSMDGLLTARSALNKTVEEKVSFNAFLIKFAAEALKRHRMVNAGWQGDVIVRYMRADIGLAVAQPDGLITPVVRDCWNKGIVDINRELKILIEKALDNKLKPREYSDATFTITNLGSYGIHDFTAIINPPGSAILAAGQIKKEPVIDENDNISAQSNMVLTLSCDHRVIDGAVGALFMKDLKDMMENPIKALY